MSMRAKAATTRIFAGIALSTVMGRSRAYVARWAFARKL
jgi:hypothetical protein